MMRVSPAMLGQLEALTAAMAHTNNRIAVLEAQVRSLVLLACVRGASATLAPPTLRKEKKT